MRHYHHLVEQLERSVVQQGGAPRLLVAQAMCDMLASGSRLLLVPVVKAFSLVEITTFLSQERIDAVVGFSNDQERHSVQQLVHLALPGVGVPPILLDLSTQAPLTDEFAELNVVDLLYRVDSLRYGMERSLGLVLLCASERTPNLLRWDRRVPLLDNLHVRVINCESTLDLHK